MIRCKGRLFGNCNNCNATLYLCDSVGWGDAILSLTAPRYYRLKAAYGCGSKRQEVRGKRR